MHNGEAVLLPPDANGIVRHAIIDGSQAFGQRLARRVLAVQGESPWDNTMGTPPTGFGDVNTPSVVASIISQAIRGDRGVESVDRVDFDEPTEEQRLNGELPMTVYVKPKAGNSTSVQVVA